MSRTEVGREPPDRPERGRRRRWVSHRRGAIGALGLIILALIATPLSIAASSGGASPAIKPGSYSGEVANYGQSKYIELVVHSNGTGQAQLLCNGKSAGTSATFSTAGGHLTAVKRGPSGAELWTVQGVHAALGDAPDVIAVNIVLPRACDSIGGTGYLAAP